MAAWGVEEPKPPEGKVTPPPKSGRRMLSLTQTRSWDLAIVSYAAAAALFGVEAFFGSILMLQSTPSTLEAI